MEVLGFKKQYGCTKWKVSPHGGASNVYKRIQVYTVLLHTAWFSYSLCLVSHLFVELLWLLYLLSFIGGTVSKNLIMLHSCCNTKPFWFRNAKHPWSVSYNCPAPKVPEASRTLAFQRLRGTASNCHDTKGRNQTPIRNYHIYVGL